MSAHGLPSHLDPRGRHRGGAPGGVRGGMRGLRPFGRVIGSLVSIGLLLVSGYVWYQFRDLNNNTSRIDVRVGAEAAPGSSAPADIDGKDQNILVVGNDDRQNMTDAEVKELHVGRDGGSLATDTMMIVHVPANGSRATLISLPRDTLVDVPDGYGMNKLNAPYALAYSSARDKGASLSQARAAGANLLLSTITRFTGLRIDHYVQIDLLGFYRLSKAIGGVPVTLCHDVDDRNSTVLARDGERGGSGLYLSKGRHVLSGTEALAFVRQRHGLRLGDFDRVKRQQYFLTAAFRQVASVGILTKLGDLSDALKRSVYLDKTLNLLDLAKQLENLTANNIVGKTIPVSLNGDADPAKVKRFVAKVISGTNAKASTSAPATSTPAAPSSGATPAPSSSTAIDSKCIN